MKKILIFSISLLLLLTLCNCSGKGGSGSEGKSAESTKMLDKYKQIADEVNKSTPMNMGNNLTFDSAEAFSENTFKYYYTFSVVPVTSAEDFVRATKNLLAVTIKNHPEMKGFRDDQMTIIYIYRKPNGGIFSEIKITPDDYK